MKKSFKGNKRCNLTCSQVLILRTELNTPGAVSEKKESFFRLHKSHIIPHWWWFFAVVTLSPPIILADGNSVSRSHLTNLPKVTCFKLKLATTAIPGDRAGILTTFDTTCAPNGVGYNSWRWDRSIFVRRLPLQHGTPTSPIRHLFRATLCRPVRYETSRPSKRERGEVSSSHKSHRNIPGW